LQRTLHGRRHFAREAEVTHAPSGSSPRKPTLHQDNWSHSRLTSGSLGAARHGSERVERLEQAIRDAVPEWSLAEVITASQAMRGIDLVAAVTVLAETGDLSRFQNPRELMGYLGLLPSESSTGDTVNRGGITKAGRHAVRVLLPPPHSPAQIRVPAGVE
jgi:transposase